MKTVHLAVAAFSLATSATAWSQAPAPAAASAHTLSGNLTLASDYRFRGFTQTAYKPSLQGGIDFSHTSGFYLGNWNSNVEQSLYRGASLEMDFYGGYKFSAGPLNLDVGGIYYLYPSDDTGGLGKVDHAELYLGAGWSLFSAKLYYGLTNFFGLGDGAPGDTKGNYYVDLAATYDLGGGWTVSGHYGYQYVKNGTDFGLQDDDVSDYKLAVTKDLSGWLLGAALVATSDKDFFTTGVSAPKAGGKTRLVLSVGKTF